MDETTKRLCHVRKFLGRSSLSAIEVKAVLGGAFLNSEITISAGREAVTIYESLSSPPGVTRAMVRVEAMLEALHALHAAYLDAMPLIEEAEKKWFAEVNEQRAKKGKEALTFEQFREEYSNDDDE